VSNDSENILKQLLEGGVTADQIGSGVIGAVSETTGIEVESNASTNLTSIRSRNFVAGSTGWSIKSDGSIEANSGTFRGALIANSLDIPDTTTANSFHVTTTGDVWWGAAAIGNATAKVLKTGVATFTDIDITGGNA
jgi:hypothetical protein